MDTSDVAAVRAAWEVASRELGIRVATDGQLQDGDGRQRDLVAVVLDFGGDKGMAILPEWDPSLAELAASQGLGYTVLGASYETFDRGLFEDTLNDWRWRGKGQPPPWYTGEVWTE